MKTNQKTDCLADVTLSIAGRKQILLFSYSTLILNPQTTCCCDSLRTRDKREHRVASLLLANVRHFQTELLNIAKKNEATLWFLLASGERTRTRSVKVPAAAARLPVTGSNDQEPQLILGLTPMNR